MSLNYIGSHGHTIDQFISFPKSKQDKVKVTNLKNFPKLYFFFTLKKVVHATQLLKLLDKVCKYEMNPVSIVENTERPPFCPQTDRWTRWNQYTPLQLCWAGLWRKFGLSFLCLWLETFDAYNATQGLITPRNMGAVWYQWGQSKLTWIGGLKCGVAFKYILCDSHGAI